MIFDSLMQDLRAGSQLPLMNERFAQRGRVISRLPPHKIAFAYNTVRIERWKRNFVLTEFFKRSVCFKAPVFEESNPAYARKLKPFASIFLKPAMSNVRE
jgi:hypothetical protein